MLRLKIIFIFLKAQRYMVFGKMQKKSGTFGINALDFFCIFSDKQ